MKRPTRTSVILRGLSLLTVGLAACKKNPEYPVIEPFSTASWGRPLCEGLQIKVATDGTEDLLLMSPSTSADVRQGLGFPEMKNLPIYRYSVQSRKLFFVAPEAWQESSSEPVICHEQRSLQYIGTFMHDIGGHTLQFHGPVATAAQTVLTTAVSPNEKNAAVLSAEGRAETTALMPFSDLSFSGKRFHQVFRMSDATPIGKPVILANTTDRNNVRPCWSPDCRFVVYKDGKCEHLWIIEAPITSSEAEGK